MSKYAPIILIGMHRSGTSMIAKMLEDLGLFVGERKDRYNEALLFINLNNWLMKLNSCCWDNPRSFADFCENETVHRITVGYLRNILSSKHMVSYLGKRYLPQRGPNMQLTAPWGWKDPRNTYTLPIWKEVFPHAKIIHIYRNGVDVADSLRSRNEKALQRSQRKWTEGKYLPKTHPWQELKLRGIGESIRCSSLTGSFSLWESYMQEAKHHVAAWGEEALEICYEEFLAAPAPSLKRMADFCSLTASDKKVSELTGEINIDRAYAFRHNEGLVAFAESVADRLGIYGY